ncbi:hypothetical protein BV22DRAFT_1110944 [Leucogyrophana mollusca]|uniref:Uncharacterized protein n=1 Tax=Leucogyrophana mollusca TaxID=85980 RepID=A0ACB8BQD8_9AGAM|nr:hypothetical protein BV22DRAFT_1110944 [Leucogyrophana mollusca]
MVTCTDLLSTREWRVVLSTDWDVLGPFPIHAREQHYLSPSFPIDLSEPIDLQKRWPSSYADGGDVSWGTARSDEHGNLKVSYPHVRWEQLRATEGWAAMQHHSVLRTSLTMYPPSASEAGAYTRIPRLRVELLQGSYFTIVPADTQGFIPQWYSGNIYAMERSQLQTVDLPIPPTASGATKYDLFISGDYEIRLFGDPRAYNSAFPILSINLQVELDIPELRVVHEPSHDVVCDFVDGFAFGSVLGVGLRSLDGWWSVIGVKLELQGNGLDEARKLLSLRLVDAETSLAPTQTRTVPISITQTGSITTAVTEIPIELLLKQNADTHSSGDVTSIHVVLRVKRLALWTPTECVPIKGTYLFAKSMPTAFLVLPPKARNGENEEAARAPILALHGAGVDIFDQQFWPDSLIRQAHSWVIMPTGRTSWGLDWRGPSAQDAWSTVDGLHDILAGNGSPWAAWSFVKNTKVVLMGHSNGGQGAWYLASRFPDRVLGVVPAAGYIKAQAYVNMAMSRSAHFVDPSLRAILESSFTPDDNDLFMSNLVDTPVLSIHGGDDENVPTWHTRELVSVLKTWNPVAYVTYREDPGKPHWYYTVLKNKQVQAFLDSVLDPGASLQRSRSFTLTVAVPSESGSLHGWRILALEVPGRLARLYVKDNDGAVAIKATNVSVISVDLSEYHIDTLTINGSQITTDLAGSNTAICLVKTLEPGAPRWIVSNTHSSAEIPPQYTRIQSVLNTAAPVVLVIPKKEASPELSVALRIAHDLQKFHKLDSRIDTGDTDLLSLESGNLVVIGGAQTVFVQAQLERLGSPFKYQDGVWTLEGREFDRSSTGMMFLQQHPASERATILFVMSTDQAGLERVARLFPIRTGVSVPDWVVVGAHADRVGAAGIEGAGVWKACKSNAWRWEWNEHMSWLD